MISTPARRISLRRKRCAGNAGSSDSPVSKRVSPSIEDLDEEELKSSRDGSHVKGSYYVRNVQDSVVAKLPSTPKNNVVGRNEEGTVDQQDHHQQHSPDTPFMSSQLCGTQECEVVWDCNSPGYSKDDLKRMPGGDCNDVTVSSPITFVAPAPHRMLFPRSRMRSQPRSAKDTTAQLDELLNQLSTKGNKSNRSPVNEPTVPDGEGKLIPNGNSCSPPSEELGLSPSTPPEAPILRQSSQPFEAHEIVPQEEAGNIASDTSAANAFEDSLWGDDLNMGVCDISGVSEASDSVSKEKLNVIADEKENVPVADAVKDAVDMSTDVFDDDLFNDSVIRSTQAVEEAMGQSYKAEPTSDTFGIESLSSKVKGVGINVRGRSYAEKRNFVAGIRKTSSVSEDEGVVLSQTAVIGMGAKERNLEMHCSGDQMQSVKNADALSRYSKGSGANNLLYAKKNDQENFVQTSDGNRRDINENQVSGRNSKSSSDSMHKSTKSKSGKTSPIVGKQRKSPARVEAPQRRVRSSFLLSSAASAQPRGKPNLPESTGDGECNTYLEENSSSKRNNDAFSVNQRISSKLENTMVGTKSDLPERTHSVNVTAPLTNKFCSVSNSASTTVQGTKYMNKDYGNIQAKRPLFRNEESNKEKFSDRGQTPKGQLSRSHSTDDAQAKATKQSSSFRRVNSSASVELSREFEEDDEFFEAILCTLPEEEQLYEGTGQAVAPKTSLGKLENLKSGRSLTLNQQSNSQKLMANQQEHHRLMTVGPGSTLGSTKPLHGVTTQDVSGFRNIKGAASKPTTKPLQSAREDSRPQFKHSSVRGRSTCQDDVPSVPKSCTSVQDDFGASDILDDDFFEDDVLTFIEEVESQYSSQQSHGEASNSQQSHSQQMKCTQEEIARKKEAAQRLREQKQRQRHMSGHYRPVC
ncbi:uncharacterized protein LOC134781102 [Penaeus indicus]|uniref:uncharacterized protein LOC134781102 n=1 Tax=Penaeus indicus TaxID=29960 RepID=UPI00300CAE09